MYEIRYQDAIRFTSSQIKRFINAVKENVEKQLSSRVVSYDLKKRQEEVLKHVTSAVNILIDVNQVGVSEINLNNLSQLLSKGKELNLPVNIFVTGGSVFNNSKERINLLFDNKDMNKLKQIDVLLVENNLSGLKFIEDENFPQRCWAYKDVENANAQIDNVVKFIKDNKMSPYEAAAVIHKGAQERFGYKNGEFDILNVSCVVDITKHDETICFGFAKYCKAIADKLCMPGLEYETFMSKLELIDNFEMAEELGFTFSPTGHVQNLVRIYDSKYDINGSYVSDACFDCKNRKYLMGKGFSSFMFPVGDLLNYKSLSFTQPYKGVESFISGGDEPAIIKYNKYNSKPIDYDKFIKCIKSIYSCLYNNENKSLIEKRIDDVLENSFEVASGLFNEKSNNVFFKCDKTKTIYKSSEKTKQ